MYKKTFSSTGLWRGFTEIMEATVLAHGLACRKGLVNTNPRGYDIVLLPPLDGNWVLLTGLGSDVSMHIVKAWGMNE